MNLKSISITHITLCRHLFRILALIPYAASTGRAFDVALHVIISLTLSYIRARRNLLIT